MRQPGYWRIQSQTSNPPLEWTAQAFTRPLRRRPMVLARQSEAASATLPAQRAGCLSTTPTATPSLCHRRRTPASRTPPPGSETVGTVLALIWESTGQTLMKTSVPPQANRSRNHARTLDDRALAALAVSNPDRAATTTVAKLVSWAPSGPPTPSTIAMAVSGSR
jgi:hypothetical protein